MPKTTTVKPLERKVLRDTVYDSLLDMLMSGVLAPGTPLSIDRLATELRVSPTPVRAELVHLERTGLISRSPLRGYRVASPLDPEQIAQLYDARIVIETGALELAFTHPDLVAELSAAHAEHERAGQAVSGVVPDPVTMNAYREYMDADWDFHHTIFRLSNNAYLMSTADLLPAHLHRLRQSVSLGINDAHLAVAEHAAVLHAVTDGDLVAARQALRDHLLSSKMRSAQDETRAVG